ncbi:MAG: hypothetical protein AAB049_00625 [Nitrospirota bacterium]
MLKRRASSILMGMQSTTSNVPRMLAATVMAALFSCQVIGSMCMMMSPGADASAVIHGVHVAHLMGEVGMCQDSIPSSQKSKGTSDSSPFPWLKSCSVDLTPTGAPPMQSSARLLQTSDPPLYARLSTFRI